MQSLNTLKTFSNVRPSKGVVIHDSCPFVVVCSSTYYPATEVDSSASTEALAARIVYVTTELRDCLVSPVQSRSRLEGDFESLSSRQVINPFIRTTCLQQ